MTPFTIMGRTQEGQSILEWNRGFGFELVKLETSLKKMNGDTE